MKLPVKKVRPDFLKNEETGKNLELDAYCETNNFKIAVEYNGSQHYKHVPLYHTEDEFYKLLERDKLKRKLCKKNGVDLIIVPSTIKYEDIFNYIVKKMIKKGYNIPKNIINSFDINIVYNASKNTDKTNSLIEFIQNKGGQLLDGVYSTSDARITVKCRRGHIWNPTITSLLHSNGWCRKCGYIDSEKLKINKMKTIECRKKLREEVEKNGKICEGPTCNGKLKPISEFVYSDTYKDSYYRYCNKCLYSIRKERKINKKLSANNK